MNFLLETLSKHKVSGTVNTVEERTGNKGAVAGQTADMGESAMTGDGQNLTVWLALILMSVTGTLWALLFIERRGKQSGNKPLKSLRVIFAEV